MAHKHVVYPTLITLTGNRSITAAEAATYTVFCIDPGGANRDVTLPAATGDGLGVTVEILNCADAGSEDITVKNAAGTSIATISQNESCRLVATGSLGVPGGVTGWVVSVGKIT